MFEKVNKFHPDKVADRIAGAVVDLATHRNANARVACEVLIGHGTATIIVETNTAITRGEIRKIVKRIAGAQRNYIILVVPQDKHLAENQREEVRCGDNGIFKGVPITEEQEKLTKLAMHITAKHQCDGKYVINGNNYTICQSHASEDQLRKDIDEHNRWNGEDEVCNYHINPLGYWSGGLAVDSGATNRKLGSDMGDGVTGGGLHGKDLSKADVSVNIVCHILAQQARQVVTAHCSIGDNGIVFQYADGREEQRTYKEVVERARQYINEVGGFEKFAEWGLV